MINILSATCCQYMYYIRVLFSNIYIIMEKLCSPPPKKQLIVDSMMVLLLWLNKTILQIDIITSDLLTYFMKHFKHWFYYHIRADLNNNHVANYWILIKMISFLWEIVLHLTIFTVYTTNIAVHYCVNLKNLNVNHFKPNNWIQYN